jgi:hypothetical protein
MIMREEGINLPIGRAEALVLFEMLADFYSQPAIEVSSPAERLALVRLHGALEKTLVEPFMDNYRALVDEARARLIAESGSSSSG